MVVNVDHTCPACTGIGPCELCSNRGYVRAPADQHMVEQVRTQQGDEAADEALEAYENTDMYDAEDEWMKTPAARLVTSRGLGLGEAMEMAFEAGYRAGKGLQ